MNQVIETQAQVLADLNCSQDEFSCHIFLENQHFPLNIQDKILNEIGRLKVPNAGNIAKVIDNCR
ncbi:MAG: hypothetical protein HRU25_11345 [Psychrobium sp.]|nr:hypothetical protein [Psychrobium sp.]